MFANFQIIWVVSYLVKLRVRRINRSCAQISFLFSFADQGVLNEDPTVWVDGCDGYLSREDLSREVMSRLQLMSHLSSRRDSSSLT